MTIDLYPSMVHEGDISRDVGSDEIDDICQQIHDACKGFGTNERALIHALGTTSQESRYKIPIRYEQMFEKDLYEMVKSETNHRPMGKTLQFLSVNPVDTECLLLNQACQGRGHDLLLTTIVAARSNKEIDILKKAYFNRFSHDLGSVIAKETTGHFEQILLSSLQAMEKEYNESEYDDARMKDDIKHLHQWGLGKMGCDEAKLFRFLTESPGEYLKKINLGYAEENGFTLGKALEKEFSGDTEAAATFILTMKINPPESVAKLIYRATKGWGTDETLLQATLIRYQGIMNDVKLAYVDEFGKTIQDVIREDCSGEYEQLLLAIVGE